MPRSPKNGVYGPYAHGRRWRIFVRPVMGRGSVVSFETREAAQRAADALLAATSGQTVGEVIDLFLESLKAKGRKDGTVTTARFRLRAMLEPALLWPLGELTTARLETLYKKRTTALTRRKVVVAVDTHQGELVMVSAMLKWCVHPKRKLLKFNPAEAIERIGKKSRGKPQLKVDHARKLYRTCLAAFDAGDASALAVAIGMVLGPRASEIVLRTVSDIDDNGRALIIDKAKTKSGDRRVRIPEVLASRLALLVHGKPPTACIWGDRTKRGNPLDRHWLRYHTRRLCALAGVDVISPHSLRGLSSTTGMEAGEAIEAIAKRLGQGGARVTRRHYLAAGTEESEQADAVAGMLDEPMDAGDDTP